MSCPKSRVKMFFDVLEVREGVKAFGRGVLTRVGPFLKGGRGVFRLCASVWVARGSTQNAAETVVASPHSASFRVARQTNNASNKIVAGQFDRKQFCVLPCALSANYCTAIQASLEAQQHLLLSLDVSIGRGRRFVSPSNRIRLQ